MSDGAKRSTDAKGSTDAKRSADAKRSPDAKRSTDAKRSANAKKSTDAMESVDAKSAVDARLPLDARTTVDSHPCSRHVPWTNHMLPSPNPIPQLDGLDLGLTCLFADDARSVDVMRSADGSQLSSQTVWGFCGENGCRSCRVHEDVSPLPAELLCYNSNECIEIHWHAKSNICPILC